MSLVKWNDMIGALAPRGSDQSFAKRIRLWNASRCLQHAKTHGPQCAVSSGGEHGIAIMDHESVRFVAGQEASELLPVHSAVACSVVFQCRIRRVPISITRNT